MPRKPKKLPHYFTMEEASELILAVESSDTRLAMRLMLQCGLRVSEDLAVRPSHLRFDRSPPIISLPADIIGNEAKTAREIPIPDDLVEILRNRASGETRERNRPLVDLSRQGDEEGRGGGRHSAIQSPSPRLPSHLRAALHTPGRTGQRPAEVAGPLVAGHDHAIRIPGGRAPFIRDPDMNDPFESWELDGYPSFFW